MRFGCWTPLRGGEEGIEDHFELARATLQKAERYGFETSLVAERFIGAPPDRVLKLPDATDTAGVHPLAEGDEEPDHQRDREREVHHGVYLTPSRPMMCSPTSASATSAKGLKWSIGTVPSGLNFAGRMRSMWSKTFRRVTGSPA